MIQKLAMQLRNPVLLKEFKSRMRTFKTPILLMLYLLVIGVVTFAFIYLQYSRSYFNPGQSRGLFIFLSVGQLILIAFVAPGLTAGAISGERERQTLNILLTTHLSPVKIVLSKLVSSLSFMALLIISTLPLYAVVFLYGGVSPGQVIGVFGFYLVVMLLFGAVGVFCSAWFKRTGVSTVLAYGITLVILGGTALLTMFVLQYMRVITGIQGAGPSIFFLSALNPVLNLVSLFEPTAATFGNSPSPGTPGSGLPMNPQLYFICVYLPVSALLIALSVRLITPVKRSLFGTRAKRGETP